MAPVTVRIGVLAKRGPAIALARWSPTADYLSRTIPGYRFVVTPLDFEEIPPVAKTRGIDFLLANSAIYVQSEHDLRAFRIATMNNRSGAYPLDKFGGVIFTRRENTQINNLEDLQQHTLAAVNATSLGGFLMAWRELKESGIDIKQELQIRFQGTHDVVVRRHHGRLSFETEVGEGSVFTVLLPLQFNSSDKT
jgi:ABC-type phosphate/phosphonate transport system substrate-binding protein